MQCLQGYIGLRGCKTAAVPAGGYINTLPGISLESLEKIADSEQGTYVGVWNDVETRAIQRIEDDIKERLSVRVKLKNPRYSYNLGKKIDTSNPIAPALDYRGGVLSQKYCGNSEYMDSVFMHTYIQTVSIYALAFNDTDTTELLIYDLDTNTVLYKKEFLFDHIGWHDIEINKLFDSKRTFFGFKSGNVWSSASLKITPDGCGGCEGCENEVLQGYVYTDGPATLTPLNISDTYGVSLVGGLQCGYDAIVCANKNLFKRSLSYALGIEIMMERLFSPRKNVFTTIEKEKGLDMRDYYSKEYDKSLKQAILALNISSKDGCIECNSQVTYRESTP